MMQQTPPSVFLGGKWPRPASLKAEAGKTAAVPRQPCAGCGKAPDPAKFNRPGGADALVLES